MPSHVQNLQALILLLSRRRARQFMIEEEEDEVLLRMIAEDQDRQRVARRGSVPGRQFINRDHAAGHARIIVDYFCDNPVYTDAQFRRRYRMRRHLFLRVMNDVTARDPWFSCRPDATGLMGLSPFQKCIAVLRILAYGVPADAVDEYVRIAESTATEALNRFCAAVVQVYEEHYLRAPTPSDVAALLAFNTSRGFPGMLGSIDCMHWEWKNCPTAWQGQFAGRSGNPSMVLEVVASHDLWIWHAYLGMPGSNNDINVLHRSSLFRRQIRGETPPVEFTINSHTYDMGYYLADGIYPDWPAFLKTVRHPITNKDCRFAAVQEGARKDIERAFGVLQSRWAIIRGPAYGWDRHYLKNMMMACIILHNMIVEDERGEEFPEGYTPNGPHAIPYSTPTPEQINFIGAHHKLRDQKTYKSLMRDHIEHIWNLYGAI